MTPVLHAHIRYSHLLFWRDTMNKEQIKGSVKDLTGKAQQAAG
jgi:hypothetical protein